MIAINQDAKFVAITLLYDQLLLTIQFQNIGTQGVQELFFCE